MFLTLRTSPVYASDMFSAGVTAGSEAECVSVCVGTGPVEESISLEGMNSLEKSVSVEHVRDAVVYLFALSVRQMEKVNITVTCFLKAVLASVNACADLLVRHFSILNRFFICCFRL